LTLRARFDVVTQPFHLEMLSIMRTRPAVSFITAIVFAVSLLLSAPGSARATAVGITSSFQFSSFLLAGTKAANGTFDLQFLLYTQPVGGSQVGQTSSAFGVRVTKGSYSAVLDFGVGAFTGEPRWIEVRYRKAGVGAYLPAAQRIQVLAVPYAMMSANAEHANVADAVSGSVNSAHAETADFATNAGHATTANSANTATTATYASLAAVATVAITATSATVAASANAAALAAEAQHAANADHALNADSATNAENATHADTADFATTAGAVTGQEMLVRSGSRNITGTLTSATEQLIQTGVVSITQGVFENHVNFPEAFDTRPVVFLSYLGTDAAGGSDWQDTVYNSPGTGIYLQANQVSTTRFVMRHGIGGPSADQTHKIAWLAIGTKKR
jgi:hypothetical protein